MTCTGATIELWYQPVADVMTGNRFKALINDDALATQSRDDQAMTYQVA